MKNVTLMTLALCAGSASAFAQAPTANDLGALPLGVSTRTNALDAAAIYWYKATLPATNNFATPKTVDLTTNGSAIASQDTVLFCFDNAGNFVSGDDDSGLGFLSFLSFGFGGGSGMGSGAAFSDGFNGKLAGGDYYFGIIEWGAGNWDWTDTNWGIIVDPTGSAGDVTLQTEVTEVIVPPATPPTATQDLGTLGGNPVVNIAALAAGEVKWVKFTLAGAADQASGKYVDINTIGSLTTGGTAGDNDTEIGLYFSNGLAIANNDDLDGAVNRESALTFGADVARTHDATTFVYDGIDSDLVAGTYYLAVGTFNVAFGVDSFNATSTSAASGSLVVNFFTNISAQCSLADVGVQGGTAGHDNLLNNDDFVAFIDLFFAQSPAADVGVQGGGPGSDGLWNNDDFVAFIDLFFAGGCNG